MWILGKNDVVMGKKQFELGEKTMWFCKNIGVNGEKYMWKRENIPATGEKTSGNTIYWFLIKIEFL